MRKLIMKEKVVKTEKAILGKLDKALAKIYPSEEYRDSLAFGVDVQDDEMYRWDIETPEGEKFYLIYEKSTGCVYQHILN